MKNEPQKKYGWGGARTSSGRRQKTGAADCMTLSAHVPTTLVNALKEAAEDEGVSLSSKVTEILNDWIDHQNDEPEKPEPDARTQALNRLADALEKIVERVSIDKE